jgi:hypothetical protein
MEYKNLFDVVEHLNTDKRTALVAVCREMGLSNSAIQSVEESARLLREFELYEKPSTPTKKALRDSVKRIATLSSELRCAIGKTATLDKVEMHQYMDKNCLREGLPWPSHVPIRGIVEYLGIALERLEEAALEVQKKHLMQGVTSGRRSFMHRYYDHLEMVWESVKDEGFSVGRGGKFERLCEAVFQAAGVPSSAEGAVRFFVEYKNEVDAGRKADWDEVAE